MKITHGLPFIIFMALMITFITLLLHPRNIETISKPVPAFTLQGLSDKDLSHGTSLVNFFASWCVPCRAEHPLLMAFDVPMYGVAYKDKDQDLKKYLKEMGNPYKKIASDYKGTAFIDWGLSGVPETFVVHDGVIRYHHSGPLTEKDLRNKILPLIEQLGDK